MGIVPGGEIVYSSDLSPDNFFVGKLSPSERLKSDSGKINNVIAGDPVYFSLRTPRLFDRAEISLRFKNFADASLIEAGVLADKKIWRYDLKPVKNRIIDQAALVWEVKKEGNIILLANPEAGQKEKIEKSSIADFLESLPDKGQVAEYNYELRRNFTIPDYDPDEQKERVIVPKLIGAYQFYVYLKNEELDIEFEFADLNKNRDSDDIALYLYLNNELIDVRRLEDDGIAADGGETKAARKLSFKLADLPEGAYKMEVKANNDIVSDFTAKQNKIAFIGKIDLYRAGGKDLSIHTSSRQVQFTTTNPDCLQAIKLDGREFLISETYRQFKQDILGASSTALIVLEKDGIAVSGDGIFAFSAEAFFDPRPKKADKYLDIRKNGINYIVADYVSPEKAEDWELKTVEFDLRRAYRENGRYGFIISAPDLKEGGAGIELAEIQIRLSGKSLWQKISEIIKK